MKGVPQLVILSGKGGTGKTTVAAAFAHLAATGRRSVRAVLADVDVNASNLELVLHPQILQRHDFTGGQVAVIDPSLCSACGLCGEVCRFDAVWPPQQASGNGAATWSYRIDPIACDGCAACVYQCPEEAIHMEPRQAGHWFRSDSRFGPLFHAALRPAQEGSGRLVTTVRAHARQAALDEGYEVVVLDGPPGIGCPAISAATGTDLALVVTEPTVAGIHDLERVLLVTAHFGLPTWVCINKADLHAAGTARIESYCQELGIPVVGHIPFDLAVAEAMAQGLPVTLYQAGSAAAVALRSMWARIRSIIEELS